MKPYKQDLTGALSSLKEHFGWKFTPLTKPLQWHEKAWNLIKKVFNPESDLWTRKREETTAEGKVEKRSIREDALKILTSNVDISTEDMVKELKKLGWKIEEIRSLGGKLREVK
ncbi:MAG: hypothetical protein HWN68_18045 [Desulfobacterales bacterium]|nr:hypothetical protein [Desulfobacterales bacterium]